MNATAVAASDGQCDPPRRGRPRSAEVDDAILAATIELAGEVGVSKMSMDDLAVRAKVSKATIYRRWPSKEHLVLDALRWAMNPFVAIDTGSLRGDLDSYLGEMVKRLRNGKMSDVLPHLIEVACHDDKIRSSLDDYIQSRRKPLRTILDRAAKRGELSNELDREVVIDLIIGPLMYRKLLSHQVIDLKFVDKLLAIVLPDVTPRT